MRSNTITSLSLKKTALAKGVNDSTASDQLPKNSSTSPVANNTTSNKPISTNDGAETTGKKRYRGKFAICDNCEEQYDVSNNHKGDCTWHDGMYLFLYSPPPPLFPQKKTRFTSTISISLLTSPTYIPPT